MAALADDGSETKEVLVGDTTGEEPSDTAGILSL